MPGKAFRSVRSPVLLSKTLGFITEEKRSPGNFITGSDLCFKIILCVPSINWIEGEKRGGRRGEQE